MRDRALRFLTLACAAMLPVQWAAAACLDDTRVAALVAGYPHTPISGLPADLSLDDAYCSQQKYVALLRRTMGEPVGYKVGFTGKPTQERFGIPAPATGLLFEPMFIEDGGRVARDFGYRPAIEPDLMVVVKDAGIMTASTELEVAEHLSSVHAFIELPAIQFAVEEKITGPGLVAVNIVATRMVQGPGAPVEATPAFVQAMADLQTVFSDETGTVIQKAPASTLLGNPLRVVLWLVDEFKRRGKTLRAGDRLSLGAVGRLFPLGQDGRTYIYTLDGLPGGAISTSVRVE
ncbi:MAG: hydratase [Gammaproteobacteria bacterium]|nr:hydratase [Gammaproteobacteria bacterium]NIM73997.1 hydratase [Gammaproteobacteria bacterium]NIN38878.1 hydratase [Gammaproteobacteria bacterium]NIO25773.1 hydratase [Gammaproteobacteria bacterium]NIO66403.1 hydratase [Gammaproteobacteria bacterium]